MVEIDWCKKTRNGLQLIEPNKNMSDSYIMMAKESLDLIKNVSASKIWKASISYYAMYYSLYSVMMKIGVKCEIHACSLEFMKKMLKTLYSPKEIELIDLAFSLRNKLQYYPGQLIKDSQIEKISQDAINFFVRSNEIISFIKESEIKEIRKLLN